MENPFRYRTKQEETSVDIHAVLVAHGFTTLEEGKIAPLIDLSLFGELPTDLEKNIRLEALTAADYLSGPILLDKFGDQEIDPWERRQLRADLIKEYGHDMEEQLERNRMKPNRMLPFLTQTDRLVHRLQSTSVRSLALQQLEVHMQRILAIVDPFETFGQRYIHMPLEERIETVKKLSESAHAFLTLVEKHEEQEVKAA